MKANFSVSRLLKFVAVETRFSKPPKYTFKPHSTRLNTSLLTLYQIKIRKLKHQSNYNAMPFCIWPREIEYTHSSLDCLLQGQGLPSKKKRKHGKLKLLSALHVLLFHFGHDHQQHYLPFSPSHSKFFLLDEKVI